MKAEIIASGTELLLGETADTNTAFIARELAILGIDLYYSSIVGDNYERFMGVLKQALQRSDIVIITGGLGPTRGDITREVIAGTFNEKMEIDPEQKQRIVEFFERMHLQITENNYKQAAVIPSAVAISNPLGTAPGWWAEKNGKTVVALPGPPGEMQPMWRSAVFSRLEQKGEAVIMSRTLKTWGLSEAMVDQMVGPYMSMSNPTLALYAKSDGIQMRITAKSDSRSKAAELIRRRESEIRQILKDNIWGTDNDVLEEVISRLIISKELTLAVAESFTGGFLSFSLSSAPESKKFFRGGITAVEEQNRVSLGVLTRTDEKAGDSSASRMADIARRNFNADIGIGIDGYIENTPDAVTCKAYISLSLKDKGQNISQTHTGRPLLLVRRSVMHALFALRTVLLEYD
ncbi:MAG: CinA family nicotinamide mononucleotide deamidase-related protein [Dehalococcoidales bacterium]|nr:CinA family nicotinamide mononucleotide deamidase-related protein [Dehalococcoidales bacterium]